MFKTFSFNPELMKISNIFNNDTEYKNIYEYVASLIKKKTNFDLISTELIKQVVMPGAYGQSVLKFIKNADSLLQNNEDWVNLEQNEINSLFETTEWEKLNPKERKKEINQFLASIEKMV
jgi:hypothetical protein